LGTDPNKPICSAIEFWSKQPPGPHELQPLTASPQVEQPDPPQPAQLLVVPQEEQPAPPHPQLEDDEMTGASIGGASKYAGVEVPA
jgi:hypothetical protein